MPTPRYHGGAPIQHYPLNTPAFLGVNRQARNAVLGPEWATRLENTVLDAQGRVAARKGFTTLTSTPAAKAFRRYIEYNNSGTMELIAVSTDGLTLYKSADDGSTWSDITGAAGVTKADGQFVIFNDIVYYLQPGDGILRYNGVGNFSDLGATGEPTGGIGLVFAGRLWAVDSTGIAVKYCALLDPSDWTGTDAGTFDFTSVWGTQESITAIATFNGALVVFGTKHIVIMTDGQGSQLGIDPLQTYVADTINGIGCIARDTVVDVKGDLWFLDDTGVHSLGRLVSERSNPLMNISVNVQDEIVAAIEQVSTLADVRAVYSPRDRFYLLSCPVASGSAEIGSAFCFDTLSPIEGGAYRCTGIWNQLVPTAMVLRDDLSLTMTLRTVTGEVGVHTGNTDDGASYTIEYESAGRTCRLPISRSSSASTRCSTSSRPPTSRSSGRLTSRRSSRRPRPCSSPRVLWRSTTSTSTTSRSGAGA